MSLIQQASISRGLTAANANEQVLFAEAFLVREAILAAPEEMTDREQKEYFRRVCKHFIEVSKSRFEERQIPYILGAFTFVRKEAREKGAYTKESFLRLFVRNSEWEVFAIPSGETRRFQLDDITFYGEPDLYWIRQLQTFNEARRNRGDPLLAPSMANPHLQRFPLFLEHQEYIVFKGKDVITTGAGNESDADEGADDQSNVDEGADDQSDADEGADDKAEQFQVEVTSRHDKSEQRQVKVPSRIAGMKKRPRVSTDSSEANAGQAGPSTKASTKESGKRPQPRPKKRRAVENSDDDIQVENPPKPVSMYGRKGKGHAVEPPSKPSQDDDVEMNVADSAEYAEWNENAKEPPSEFMTQNFVCPKLLVRRQAPLPCEMCLKAERPCFIWMERFHCCLYCKKNGKSCSLCPQFNGVSKDKKGKKEVTLRNITSPQWCWYITAVNLAISYIQMLDPEGPRDVLPLYNNIEFSPFPKKQRRTLRTMTMPQVSAYWRTFIKSDEFVSCDWTGVPYEKIREEEHPDVRGLWPIVPASNGETPAETLEWVLDAIDNGTLERSWANGYGKETFNVGKGKAKSDGEEDDGPSDDADSQVVVKPLKPAVQKLPSALKPTSTKSAPDQPTERGRSSSRATAAIRATRSTTRARKLSPSRPGPIKKGYIGKPLPTHRAAPSKTLPQALTSADPSANASPSAQPSAEMSRPSTSAETSRPSTSAAPVPTGKPSAKGTSGAKKGPVLRKAPAHTDEDEIRITAFETQRPPSNQAVLQVSAGPSTGPSISTGNGDYEQIDKRLRTIERALVGLNERLDGVDTIAARQVDMDRRANLFYRWVGSSKDKDASGPAPFEEFVNKCVQNAWADGARQTVRSIEASIQDIAEEAAQSRIAATEFNQPEEDEEMTPADAAMPGVRSSAPPATSTIPRSRSGTAEPSTQRAMSAAAGFTAGAIITDPTSSPPANSQQVNMFGSSQVAEVDKNKQPQLDEEMN